ncbi:MAG TPA: hypothetical protein VG818_03485 [Gemmatimonadaceae bacterium]|jgi:hypothetical protein|nr:hypothetical protein [Gemmatimonadaceae bacterium]
MLAFLDALCAALVRRDRDEIRRLLRHPLAHALPRPVREEGTRIARQGPAGHLAPVQSLRFYHQTMQLLATPTHGAAPAPTSAPTQPR